MAADGGKLYAGGKSGRNCKIRNDGSSVSVQQSISGTTVRVWFCGILGAVCDYMRIFFPELEDGAAGYGIGGGSDGEDEKCRKTYPEYSVLCRTDRMGSDFSVSFLLADSHVHTYIFGIFPISSGNGSGKFFSDQSGSAAYNY